MKSLLLTLILVIIGGASIKGDPLIDDSDPYPYGPLASASLDKVHDELTLTVKMQTSATGKPIVMAEVKLYNNTGSNIWMVDTTFPEIDINFEVKDSSGAIFEPNSRLNRFLSLSDKCPRSPIDYSPGQSRSYFLNLLKIYDFEPGQTYSVRAWRIVHSDPKEEKIKFTSKPVQFTMP